MVEPDPQDDNELNVGVVVDINYPKASSAKTYTGVIVEVDFKKRFPKVLYDADQKAESKNKRHLNVAVDI